MQHIYVTIADVRYDILIYILGFLILSIIIWALIYSPVALLIVSLIFIILTMREYRKMFVQKQIYPHKFIPEIISFICTYCFIYNKHSFVMPVLVFGIFLSFFITVVTNKKPYLLTTFSTITAFMLTFCTLYIIKIAYLLPENNVEILLVYIFAVMAGDFSASQIGPMYKIVRLAPDISPNKTVLGSIANLFFTCLISCLFIPLLKFKLWQVLLFGICVSFAAQIGDLSISAIKRDLNIRHSSTLFCSYGGILDRVDAFIFSAPAAYYCAIFISELNY